MCAEFGGHCIAHLQRRLCFEPLPSAAGELVCSDPPEQHFHRYGVGTDACLYHLPHML
jgi:hypothetical protein